MTLFRVRVLTHESVHGHRILVTQVLDARRLQSGSKPCHVCAALVPGEDSVARSPYVDVHCGNIVLGLLKMGASQSMQFPDFKDITSWNSSECVRRSENGRHDRKGVVCVMLRKKL